MLAKKFEADAIVASSRNLLVLINSELIDEYAIESLDFMTKPIVWQCEDILIEMELVDSSPCNNN